jgi:hypothetical protein
MRLCPAREGKSKILNPKSVRLLGPYQFVSDLISKFF